MASAYNKGMEGVLSPQHADAVGQAYGRVSQRLNGKMSDFVKDVVVTKLLEIARTGEREPSAMADRVLDSLLLRDP